MPMTIGLWYNVHVQLYHWLQVVTRNIHAYTPLHVVWLESGIIIDHVVVGGGDCALTHMLTD